MVIRRIREHVAAQNWFAVGIDFLIVVAGIVIGTQVNNWNQSRIERSQGRDYRARLIEELDFNARQFRQKIAYYEQVKGHGLSALKWLQSPTPQSDQKFLVDAYQATQIEITSAKRFIYDEMVSTGLVDRLGSEENQAVASDYYLNIETRERTLREILPYRTIVRAIMPYPAQAQIRDRCGDISVFYQQRIIGYRLPKKCDAVFEPSVVTAGVARIRAHPGIADDLTRYLASLDEKLDQFESNLILTDALKAKLIDAAR